LRVSRFAFVSQRSGDSEMRVDEVWLDRQRLVVLRDRFIKSSHLQQQLRVRIIRVRIVRDQLDVFLERILSVVVILILTIGITENVESGGIVGRELGGAFVVTDGLREILLAEVVTAEIE